MNDTPEIVTASDISPVSMPTPTVPTGTPAPAPAAPALDTAKIDRGGIVFDPARHIDRQNKLTGRWMPRGGRKPGVKSSPPPAPVQSAPSFIPKDAPPAPAAEKPATPGATAVEPAADNSEDAAECAARALQFAAGTVFDAHKDCTPPPDEHRSMTRSFAAFIRSKGWQATAGVSTLIVIAAWLLRVLQKDKPAAKVRGWLGAGKAEAAIDVTPAAAKPTAPPPPPKPSGVFEFIPEAEIPQ